MSKEDILNFVKKKDTTHYYYFLHRVKDEIKIAKKKPIDGMLDDIIICLSTNDEDMAFWDSFGTIQLKQEIKNIEKRL